MNLILKCRNSGTENRIKKNVLGDAGRNVASWIYTAIGNVSPEGAEYARNIHGGSAGGAGRVVKPFSFSTYGTVGGMNIRISSSSEQFLKWMKMALRNVKELPPVDLRNSKGEGPVLHPDNVMEVPHGKNMRVEMVSSIMPSGRTAYLAKAELFTISPLILKGKEKYMSLSEDAFSQEGAPGINKYILNNLLVKHASLRSGADNGTVPGMTSDLAVLEMAEKALTASFSRTARMGWTRVSGDHVPFIEGRFTLTTHPEYLHTALLCGVGAKNALGFGMVDMHDERKYGVNGAN